MTIRIGSNIASLTAQRRLGEADIALSKTFERLASGQRINRASDDAAGLAIADDLKARGRIYTQAIRNGNDGISLLNIADSAIDSLLGIVTRIRELSEQSANGTYSSKQREALEIEAQELSKEFTRITQSTSFNGIKIFDGSLGTGVRLQLGVGLSESINASIGGAIGSMQFANASNFVNEGGPAGGATYEVRIADMNNDGNLDLITAGNRSAGTGVATVKLGSGDGSFYNVISVTTEGTRSLAMSVGDLNGDGILDLVTGGYDAAGGRNTIRLGLGDGTFSAATYYSADSSSVAVELADLNSDGYLDLISNNNAIGSSRVLIRLGAGDGTFGTTFAYTSDGATAAGVKIEDINGDGKFDLITAGRNLAGVGVATVRMGNGNGTFGSLTTYTMESLRSNDLGLGDLNGDGILDLITTGQNTGNIGTTTVRIGLGNGAFGSASSFTSHGTSSNSLSIMDLNGDGLLDLVTAGQFSSTGQINVHTGLGNGNFTLANQYAAEGSNTNSITLGDLNGDGVLDLATGGVTLGTGRTTVRIQHTEEGQGSLLSFSLKTRSDALQSMGILDRTLENLAKQRGTIGASQSRVNIAISNLQSARENFSAAESRIRDADIASEAANLVRTQIMQQAAASVLSQANQQPSLALLLLR